jgi:hypothetical protein
VSGSEPFQHGAAAIEFFAGRHEVADGFNDGAVGVSVHG